MFRLAVFFQTVKCESEIAESIGVGGIKRDGTAELGGRIFVPLEMEQEDTVRAMTPGLVGPLLGSRAASRVQLFRNCQYALALLPAKAGNRY